LFPIHINAKMIQKCFFWRFSNVFLKDDHWSVFRENLQLITRIPHICRWLRHCQMNWCPRD
jgi:hypothetical protein